MTRRHELARFGRRGDRVRVVLDRGEGRYVVLYRDIDGASHRKKFPYDANGKAEALAWAETFFAERDRLTRLAAQPEPLTVRQLWRAYQESPAWGDLRPKSQISYAERWAKWERFIDATSLANETTLLDIDRYITRARRVMVINQVRQVLNTARIIYNWGQRRKLIATNEFALHRWKRPKDAKIEEPEEYTPDEFSKMLFALSPQNPRRWRLHVALMLAGHQGQRANAVLHLRWSDVDFAAGVIRWPSEWQKNGETFEQPLTEESRAALLTARYWLRVPIGREFTRMNHRQRIVAEAISRSPWVLPSQSDPNEPYGYQGLWIALRDIEVEAGVEHRPRRALHGLRKMVAGNVLDATGDDRLAMEWIGDKDQKQARAYLKKRRARMERAAGAVTGPKVSRNRPDSESLIQSRSPSDGSEGLTESQRSGLNRRPLGDFENRPIAESALPNNLATPDAASGAPESTQSAPENRPENVPALSFRVEPGGDE